jgi:hypothetical protein
MPQCPNKWALHALGGEGSNLQPHESESCALPVAPPPNGRTVNLADPGPPGDAFSVGLAPRSTASILGLGATLTTINPQWARNGR